MFFRKVTLLSSLVATLFVYASNVEVTGNTVESEYDTATIKASKRIDDGVIFVDNENQTYFIDYGTLEEKEISNVSEEDLVYVELNQYGEILSVEK